MLKFAYLAAAASLSLGTAVHAETRTVLLDSQTDIARPSGGIFSQGIYSHVLPGRIAQLATDRDTGAQDRFYSYCVEPLVLGADGYFTVRKAEERFSGTQLTYLANLLANDGAAIAGATNKSEAIAALGMAVWELATEKPANGYDVRSGSGFRIAPNTSASVIDLAAQYVRNAIDGIWKDTGDTSGVMWLASRDWLNAGPRQDQIFYSAPRVPGQPVSVPEPQGWAVLIVGLAMLGAIAHRRRQDAGAA